LCIQNTHDDIGCHGKLVKATIDDALMWFSNDGQGADFGRRKILHTRHGLHQLLCPSLIGFGHGETHCKHANWTFLMIGCGSIEDTLLGQTPEGTGGRDTSPNMLDACGDLLNEGQANGHMLQLEIVSKTLCEFWVQGKKFLPGNNMFKIAKARNCFLPILPHEA
jgi:hypothetical protein